MPTSAFFAVLRDAAKLAAAAADDLAAQSVKLTAAADDIAVLTGQATIKSAGVAGDDLAVGAGQINGLSPSRELPALWKIFKGSLINKAILSAVLLVVTAVYAPVITWALLLGGLYLAFEGGEGLLEKFHPHAVDDEFKPLTEADKVKGAIRTDLILSLEILIIALGATGNASLLVKAGVLFLVSLGMSMLIYGIVGLLIRLDDMGIALVRGNNSGWKKRLGQILVNAAPPIIKALDPIGMVAMFAVAGGIFVHTFHLGNFDGLAALGVDIGLGLIVGLVLAGCYTLGHKFFCTHPKN